MVVPQGTATGVAAGAVIDLGVVFQGARAGRDTGVFAPGPLAPGGQGHFKAAVQGIGQGLPFGQVGMLGPGAVAGLAAHILFIPPGVKAMLAGEVVLFDIGAVAFSTAGVPVLVGAGPVQGVAGGNGVVGVEVIPALATLRGRASIPGDGQGLQSPLTRWQQDLLQGVDPEHPLHREVFQFARGVVGAHPKGIALAIESGRDARVIEGGIGKIPQHGVRGGLLHGQVVVGAQPVSVGLLVTAGAGFAANVAVGALGQGVTGQQPEAGGGDQQRPEQLGNHHNLEPALRIRTGVPGAVVFGCIPIRGISAALFMAGILAKPGTRVCTPSAAIHVPYPAPGTVRGPNSACRCPRTGSWSPRDGPRG